MSPAWDALVIGQKVIDAAKSREGFYPRVYNDRSDGKGTLTIGYGTVDPEYAKPGVVLSEAKATELLVKEMNEKANGLKKKLSDEMRAAPIQAVWDVMLDFAYNCGEGALLNSTWLRLHYQGKCLPDQATQLSELGKVGRGNLLPVNAADAICLYSKQKGQFVQGLLNRRLMDRSDYIAAVGGPAEFMIEPPGVEAPKPQAATHPAVAAGCAVVATAAVPATLIGQYATSTWALPMGLAFLAVVIIAAAVIVFGRKS